MDLDEIRSHWQRAGEKLSLSDSVTPTSRDPYLAQLEQKNITSLLSSQQNILEVGCGDGFHTVVYGRAVKSLVAVDIADSLISAAKIRVGKVGLSNVEFLVGSVLEIKKLLGSQKFDCVVSQRCLINLPAWENQQDAILQLRDTLKPGGLLLMTEGFQDELDNLNLARRSFGLSPIKVVPYNRNLLHEEFDSFIPQHFSNVTTMDYGFYLYLSRVYHPLAVLPDQPKHDSKLNEVAMRVASEEATSDFRKYSYNLFYVLRKA